MDTAPERELLKRFGKRMAEIRKSKHVTQQQLAEAVGLSVVTIAYIETGKRWVRLKTLDKIANALEVKIASMMDF